MNQARTTQPPQEVHASGHTKAPAACDPPRDPLLHHVSEFRNRRPGLRVMDVFNRTPKTSLARYSMSGHRTKERILPTDPGALLCVGAAVVLSDDGKCRHLRSYNLPGQFAGFVRAAREDSLAHVTASGCFVLKVTGDAVKPGDKVFADDVNSFNTRGEGLQIGVVLHFEQGDMYQVMFAGHGEQLDTERLRNAGLR